MTSVRHAAGLAAERPDHDILVEKQPVTVGMAVRLGMLIGNGPVFWLNLQRAYDLERAEREVDVSTIPTLNAA